jgi:hypothetical protein
MDVAQEQRKRLAFLHLLFQRSDGDPNVKVNLEGMRCQLGFSAEELPRILDYLVEEGLIGRRVFDYPPAALYANDLGPWESRRIVQITHKGRKEMEAAITRPTHETEHFPAAAINIVIGFVAGSIQQGTDYSSQTVTQMDDSDR